MVSSFWQDPDFVSAACAQHIDEIDQSWNLMKQFMRDRRNRMKADIISEAGFDWHPPVDNYDRWTDYAEAFEPPVSEWDASEHRQY